jgi:hypothetical protein
MKFHQWEPDLITLVSRMDAGEIDLQPDFQRQEVWPVPKRRKLIDSILREWSMPPIHLIDSGSSVLEVLDGQQRLAAIRDFVHGKIAVDGSIAPKNESVSALNGLKYFDLPNDARRRIDRYTIRAFRISDYSPEEPSELFYRLNQPTLLTAGEQRNSLYGNARTQLKTLVQEFQAKNESGTIGFSNSRLAYDDVLARLLFFLSVKTILVKATEGQISDTFRNEVGFSTDVQDVAHNAIQQFSEARKLAGRIRLNKASLLSWLLFYSRGDNSEDKREFLGVFEFQGPVKPGANLAIGAKSLFNDRASGRVTDISSVFLRDVCLWLAFADIYLAEAFSGYSTTCCKILSKSVDAYFRLEEKITAVVSIEEWSKLN